MSTKGYVKYNRELLQEAVENSTSVMGVMRYLGLRPAGGNHTHMSKRIQRYGIDTSHFTGQGWSKGKRDLKKKTAEEILVVVEPDSPRPKAKMLRRAMLEVGIIHECKECGLSGEWNGRPIVLEIDHVDGDFFNNRIENLRFLCPNCHSQQSTNKPWKFKPA